MSENIDPRLEEPGGGLLAGLAHLLGVALLAMLKALAALLLAALILVARALQAVFVLARPGLMVGSVAVAGWTSFGLFGTVLARYGGDLPAGLLALTAVVIAPAALLVMAEDHGVWALCLAVAGVELLARLLLEHAPPTILAALPAVALAGCVLYHVRAEHLETREEQNDVKQ